MAKKRDVSKTPPMQATAVAKVEASAAYKKKKLVSETIPPDVTRAKAGAWLDLISPFTEWAGLKGDALRHKREMLRIQQEEVLYDIVKGAMEKIKTHSFSGARVPNKFMVQFLEKASLEERESPLIELWSNLLASATIEYDANFVHFSSIISQISAKQALLLRNIIGTEKARDIELATDNITTYFGASRFPEMFADELLVSVRDVNSIDDVSKAIGRRMNSCGVELVHASVEIGPEKDFFDLEFEYQTYQDSEEVDYAILEAIGLLRRIEHDQISLSLTTSVTLIYYHLTDLGRHFALACRIVS